MKASRDCQIITRTPEMRLAIMRIKMQQKKSEAWKRVNKNSDDFLVLLGVVLLLSVLLMGVL